MTTYTSIATINTGVGDPITTSQMTALKNNPVAIAEDDATAPDVVGANLILSGDGSVSSSTASINFTGLLTAPVHLLVVSGLTAATGAGNIPILRFGRSGTYISSGLDYDYQNLNDGSTTNTATNQNQIQVGVSGYSTTPIHFHCWIYNAQDTASSPVNVQFAGQEDTSSYFGGGRLSDGVADNFDDIQLLMTTGNITNVNAYLYELAVRT